MSLEIEYYIDTKFDTNTDYDDGIIDVIQGQNKIREAIDSVLDGLFDVPEDGEVFLWKDYENGNKDHIFFSFLCDSEGKYYFEILDIVMHVSQEEDENGRKINTFVELHDGKLTYSAY